MNRKQKRADKARVRKGIIPLTLVLPQEISEETKAALRAEATALGIKRLEFEVEIPTAPKIKLVNSDKQDDAAA